MHSPAIDMLFLSTWPPRECPTATYTHGMVQALKAGDAVAPRVMAVNHEAQTYRDDVLAQFLQGHWISHLAAAELVNEADPDLVMVEHSFDVFGGRHGGHLLSLLQRLAVPYLVTCHTVPTTPDSHQRDTLGEICHSSIGVVVTSPYARQALNQYYYVPSEKITVLPRGVGQLQPADREALKGISGLQGKTVLCTCGALGPDSGLEYGLEALARVLKTHPDVHYFIAGETHPDMPAGQGDAWRAALAGLVQALGIGAHVHFINRPLALAEQQNFLQMADIYLAPCPSWLQTTSSLLAHAVGCGRAAVATPSLHAQEMLAEGRGMLAHFQDAQSLARCINTLIENPVLKESMEACALRYGKEMAWPKVARHYEDYFTATAAEYRLPVS